MWLIMKGIRRQLAVEALRVVSRPRSKAFRVAVSLGILPLSLTVAAPCRAEEDLEPAEGDVEVLNPRPIQEADASAPAPPADPARERDDVHSVMSALIPEVHGFVSQGFMMSTNNNYLADTERGTFEFTEVGLNFTKQVTDNLRLGMQLFMRDLGPIGNYKPQFDWFYLDYRFFDWLGIRAGRTKIPFGLYNEVNDIDSARIPILLPQSVYPAANRDYLLAQTGLELYGNVPIGALGMLDYRAYGGTIYIDAPVDPTIQAFHIPYVFGGRLMWLTPLDGLQVGGTFQKTSLDAEFVLGPVQTAQLIQSGALPAGSTGNLPFQIPVTLWVASLEYTYRSFLFAAEYGRWHANIESNYPGILPTDSTENERFYVMAGWQASDWLQSSIYYSAFYPQLDVREGREAQQHDVAMTLRFDLNQYWLLKIEGHFIHGTADLDPRLNGGRPKAELDENWELLLVKTTAYF